MFHEMGMSKSVFHETISVQTKLSVMHQNPLYEISPLETPYQDIHALKDN